MIYLWTDGAGWTEHELTETDELKRRGITVGARAWVGDGATVGNGATVGDGATVGARAWVGDRAWVGARATVGDGAKPTIIYIIGSSFPLSYWGEDRIDIGCQSHTIAGWLEQGEKIGKHYQFTAEQIVEYRRYYDLIAAMHAANTDTAKARRE